MDYKLNTPPDPETVSVEIHGDATLIVANPERKFPNLTRSGAGRGKGCRGWTPAARKAVRVRLSDHKIEFKTHLCLKFPDGSGTDTTRLKAIQDKVFRWVRVHLGCHYVRKVEFSGFVADLHWHAALNATLSADQQRELSAYVGKFGLVSTVSTPDPETIARYLSKSEQTTHPPWFDKSAFKPWHCTFPKPVAETVTMSAAAALDAGVVHPKFGLNYGGAAALAELAPASMSLTGDIPTDPPLSLTRHIPPDPSEHIATVVSSVLTTVLTTSGAPEFGAVPTFRTPDPIEICAPTRDASAPAGASCEICNVTHPCPDDLPCVRHLLRQRARAESKRASEHQR